MAGSRNREKRWDKLDNTANLFPVIAGENMTNVYRMSVKLKEEIQPKLLQEALNIVLPKMDGFNLCLRRGVFWYYFEENGRRAPKVVEEHTFPCRFIHPSTTRDYLFRVTYYGCKINLEVFHVLTDGMGGINFIRELTYQYLRLAHKELQEQYGDVFSYRTSLNREDSFVKNFKKKSKRGYKSKKAYLVKGDKLSEGEFGVMHLLMPLDEIKNVAKKYDATINEYLVACFIWSIYVECLKKMPSKRAIRAAVPVNLRPFFDSITTKNFFIMVSAEFKPEKDEYTFEQVLEIIKKSLREQITKDHLEELFSYSVAGQLNKFARPVPLFLKNAYMKMVYTKSALANTTTVTNIGNLKAEKPYDEYIERFYAFIAMSKGQNIKGTICSYNGVLVYTFSSILTETSIQKCFCKQLVTDGISVSVETNGVYSC
ncbi:hypothetical protein [Lachnobacterium bovis]|uniref:hypothetical protein n=1 Tax=Lachnobacterium bovis TaxID=140626 RepID=UPI000486D616|nr:hypothetical protein [Lachnobacterium bovis]